MPLVQEAEENIFLFTVTRSSVLTHLRMHHLSQNLSQYTIESDAHTIPCHVSDFENIVQDFGESAVCFSLEREEGPLHN